MKSIVRSLAVEMALQQRAMGRRIAQLRERSRMTQEVAADKAGVTLRAYQKWEAGGGIQYANLQKLADLFNVPVERITGEEATPDPFKTGSQLDQIQLELEAARAERQDLRDQIAKQNENLAAQSQILVRLENLVRVLTGQDEDAGHPLRTVAQVAEILEAARHPAQTTPRDAKTRSTGGQADSRAS